jgi:phosphate/sulfate permease
MQSEKVSVLRPAAISASSMALAATLNSVSSIIGPLVVIQCGTRRFDGVLRLWITEIVDPHIVAFFLDKLE